MKQPSSGWQHRMNELRWGILGTAGIARKNWRAIRDSGNSTVAAVASRDVDRARAFIQECQAAAPFEVVPTARGSYDALLASPDVEAVYLPLPTGLRKEWVLRAAAAGKHVICEKPCGIQLADVQEMVDACRRNRVQFMDGVMFMHNPRLKRMREILDDGKSVGGVKRITSMFAFRGFEDFFTGNIRLQAGLEPTGCLGDLGWYCLRLALWTMNWQLPREVVGRILSQGGSRGSPTPVPTEFSGELMFNEDVSASFYSSFLVEKQQWAYISGTRGQLHLSDFVHAESEHEPVFEVNEAVVRVKCCDCAGSHDDSRRWAQEACLFRNFAIQVRSGTLNDDWPMMALKTQQVMDACFASARNGSRVVAL